MDEAEKRRLKKLGKQEVEARSRQAQERLLEANPAAIGSDAWVENYRTGTEHDRALRRAPPDRMTEAEAAARFVLSPVEGRLHPFNGVPTWYAQCSRCRDLLHTIPSRPTACSCGAVTLWTEGDFPLLRSRLAEGAALRIVKLIGRGARKDSTR